MSLLRTCTLLVVLALLPRSARADFSLADLEALDKQESWHELLVHASDVPPAQRTDKWNQMVERAALGVLGSHAGEADEAWTFGDAAVHQYPQLKKSKKFMAARAQAAIHGLEACLQRPGPIIGGRPTRADPSPCAEHAATSADADPSDPDTAFTLAKMISRELPLASVRVWRRGLAVRHAAKDCSEKLLGNAVADALMLAPEDSRVADAQAIAFELCWDGVKDAVIDRFIGEPNSKSYRKNTCSYLLAKKDALSPMSTRQCQALK